jgi:hypothetical protein
MDVGELCVNCIGPVDGHRQAFVLSMCFRHAVLFHAGDINRLCPEMQDCLNYARGHLMVFTWRVILYVRLLHLDGHFACAAVTLILLQEFSFQRTHLFSVFGPYIPQT